LESEQVTAKFQFITLPMVGSETGFPYQAASRVAAAPRR